MEYYVNAKREYRLKRLCLQTLFIRKFQTLIFPAAVLNSFGMGSSAVPPSLGGPSVEQQEENVPPAEIEAAVESAPPQAEADVSAAGAEVCEEKTMEEEMELEVQATPGGQLYAAMPSFDLVKIYNFFTVMTQNVSFMRCTKITEGMLVS